MIRRHTALESRLLSAGAGCLFGANALGAVVTSAANHCEGGWKVNLQFCGGESLIELL